MSKEWFEKIPTVKVNQETYLIIRREDSGDKVKIFFVWGKTDFMVEVDFAGQEPKLSNFSIFKKSQWFEYAGISGHGIFMEETEWKNEGASIFIETPAKYAKSILELTRIVKQNDIHPASDDQQKAS